MERVIYICIFMISILSYRKISIDPKLVYVLYTIFTKLTFPVRLIVTNYNIILNANICTRVFIFFEQCVYT